MGLDIVTYSKINKKPDDRVAEILEKALLRTYNKDNILIEVDEHFEKTREDLHYRAPDLTKGDWYKSIETKTYHFGAGSYGYYNAFRRYLSEALIGVIPDVIWRNPENYLNSPCYELIDFSDCEGEISWSIAGKLYNDMVQNEEKFKVYLESLVADGILTKPSLNFYLGTYVHFKNAFELAKEEGVVIFT
jgi:hypothetical protein